MTGRPNHRAAGRRGTKRRAAIGPSGARAVSAGIALFALVVAGVVAGVVSGPIDAAARKLPAQNPDPVETAIVTAVVDGDTVRLDTGAEVRLTGIQAPKLPLGRKGFRPWPLAAEAKAALSALSRDRRVRLAYPGQRYDRWGRLLAQMHVGDVWIQREMLLRGLARVYTFPDNRADADALYDAERAARAARRGIWALDWYRIIDAADAGRLIGTFQLVEGRIKSAAIVRGRGYLNYGDDWRSDFTVSIAPESLKLFRAAGVSILNLKDRRLRVRGWLVSRNGAMISVTHPEQIEILEE